MKDEAQTTTLIVPAPSIHNIMRFIGFVLPLKATPSVGARPQFPYNKLGYGSLDPLPEEVVGG
jgi:hypothetical protein